jgi:hypothetical protein
MTLLKAFALALPLVVATIVLLGAAEVFGLGFLF